MKTTFDILDILFSILNVDAVNNVIDGGIYRNKKPLNSEKQDIVIVPLTNINGDIQDGTVFINTFCKNFNEGIPDIAKLRLITNAVISELEEYKQNSTNYFDYNIVYQIILNDDIQKNMSYSSIKLNCYIER